MKVVILAGGLGSRLSEETIARPKPMVEIGGQPILWHIMKIYSRFGFNDFVICLGYRGYMIKEYFANFFLHNSDVTINLETNKIDVHDTFSEPWSVTLVDTGANTNTGGRIKRIKKYVADGTFLMTYGDGVGNVDIPALLDFHKKHGKLATLTAVRPEGRFGALELNGEKVIDFAEKQDNVHSWINGGFYVLEPEALDYIDGDTTGWEKEPLETLAKNDQLRAHFHSGFWKAMDKLTDKHALEDMWNTGAPPWKTW